MLDSTFIKKFNNNFNKNVKLSNYSWFNLGGNAEYFYKAKDKNQLIEFLEEAKKRNLKTTILGAGSNTLFRDNGVKGVVVKLGNNFSYTKMIDKDILDVGAGTLDRNIANFAKENNLGNLEFLTCIPGSLGGAVIMNSGCYGNDISKVLISIQAIDKDKLSEIEIKKEDIKFSYRGTNLPENLIIISAKLRGIISKKEEIQKKQSDLIERKKLSQPSQVKTCGSTFKNISEDKKAWMLIKESGCENFQEGDAIISQKHNNFFVNNGKAKSSDIENLIKKVKKRVHEKTGVNLELEIKIIGD
jgi:UDP-N-acetylmuramate dehydrogenase|tara:strand:- start:3295 stop:4197 length:903 start_codon:yes stop_codon:yes gene_type:complete